MLLFTINCSVNLYTCSHTLILLTCVPKFRDGRERERHGRVNRKVLYVEAFSKTILQVTHD